MTLAAAIRTCFAKYVTFSGRASRPEYWFFVLFLLLGSIGAGVIDGVVFGAGSVETGPGQVSARADGPVTAVFTLATTLPLISAGWRRMHDSGRSGLHLLYPFIAFIGVASFFGFTLGLDPFAASFAQGTALIRLLFGAAVIVLCLSPLIVIYWLARPSQPGPNKYGPQPIEVPS